MMMKIKIFSFAGVYASHASHQTAMLLLNINSVRLSKDITLDGNVVIFILFFFSVTEMKCE
jgi:hypothetical protein